MNFKRIWALFKARNHEFFRDKAAFGWNFIFPFLIVAGFAIIFGGGKQSEYKVGVFPSKTESLNIKDLRLPTAFKQISSLEFVGFATMDQGIDKLKHHKVDILIGTKEHPFQYWINDSSPKGYIVEKIFNWSLQPPDRRNPALRKAINGVQIRYIDWLFPGILGMNMMFSALYGVGYVIVRYRKNGVLKRLKATPLTAFEYLTSQMLSRIFLLMFSVIIMWIGCDMVFSFHVEGSLLNLFFVFFLGGLSLTSLGLVIASRGSSEEFTNGVLNFIAWPMMFLSEVWFSIEGAPGWVKTISKVFPLTPMLTAARKIMNDGAGLADIRIEILTLCGMTLLFLTIGASLFSWNR